MEQERMMSFMAVAEELTAHPSWLKDDDAIYEVCRKYGIFLDCITNDELQYLSMLINDYM